MTTEMTVATSAIGNCGPEMDIVLCKSEIYNEHVHGSDKNIIIVAVYQPQLKSTRTHCML